MADLETMTVTELQNLLARLRADLDDLEEERCFVLGQTGVHISAGKPAKYEAEVAGLCARIAEVERELAAKE